MKQCKHYTSAYRSESKAYCQQKFIKKKKQFFIFSSPWVRPGSSIWDYCWCWLEAVLCTWSAPCQLSWSVPCDEQLPSYGTLQDPGQSPSKTKTKRYVIESTVTKRRVTLHKWRLNLNNNTLYILSLELMFPDKGIFTRMRGLGRLRKRLAVIHCSLRLMYFSFWKKISISNTLLTSKVSRFNRYRLEYISYLK